MRNILNQALCEFLHNRTEKQPERLEEYAEAFQSAITETTQALESCADLLFEYGVEQDCQIKKIEPVTVIDASLSIKNHLAYLSIALAGYEQVSNAIERGQNEKQA